MSEPRIAVIGTMGAGKSTLGGILAARLGLPLIDSDRWIEAKVGMTSGEYAARHGVEALHDLEATALETALDTPGGMVVTPAASVVDRGPLGEVLRREMTVVWLDVDADTVRGRYDTGPHRRAVLADAFTALHEARRSRFEALCHLHLDATRPPEQLAAEIIDRLGAETAKRAGSVPVFEDPEMGALIDPDATVERLAQGCEWAEGPAWVPRRGVVLWSDIPNDRVMRWSRDGGVEVERVEVEFTNGRAVDANGAVVTCSHGHRRIERWEPDGRVTPLVSHYQGRRFNSPNDIVVRSDGTIWFTDPPYGILSDREGHKSEPDLAGCFVFRFDPTSGALNVATDLLSRPNGLAFSPDESVLYVSDTGDAHNIVAFDVVGGVALHDPRVLAVIEPGVPDGFRVDETGHIFTSAGDGIHVLTPEGRRIGRIPVPEVTSNCAFGGPDGTDLFITATTSLYRVATRTRGA
jgi:gluconolactonase